MNDRPAFSAAEPATRAAAARPGLLVLDDNARVPQWFRDHFGAHYYIVAAESITTAFEALAQYEIAIIVAGDSVGDESTVDFLRTVRQEAPAVMTVMLTASEDSERVVRLINEVGVCRVIFKPIKTSATDAALRAALALHVRLRARPATLRVERGGGAADVATGPKPTALTRLRAWLARAGGSTGSAR